MSKDGNRSDGTDTIVFIVCMVILPATTLTLASFFFG